MRLLMLPVRVPFVKIPRIRPGSVSVSSVDSNRVGSTIKNVLWHMENNSFVCTAAGHVDGLCRSNSPVGPSDFYSVLPLLANYVREINVFLCNRNTVHRRCSVLLSGEIQLGRARSNGGCCLRGNLLFSTSSPGND